MNEDELIRERINKENITTEHAEKMPQINTEIICVANFSEILCDSVAEICVNLWFKSV